MLTINLPVETQIPIPVPVYGSQPFIFMLDVWHYVPVPLPIPGEPDFPDVTFTPPLPAPHFDIFELTQGPQPSFMADFFGALVQAVAHPAAQAAIEPPPTIDLVGVHSFGHMIE